MAKTSYSRSLCAELLSRARPAELLIDRPRRRYEAGDELRYRIRGVVPECAGQAVLRVEKFMGGGFAGQVYRCRLESLEGQEAAASGLKTGRLYAVKIYIPPANGARRFRNAVYWLAFQGPFSAQVNYDACRCGLIWQKLIRRAARSALGAEEAVKDVYASFRDLELGSYGEISEWVEGRNWRLETDRRLNLRRRWRTVAPAETGSPEFVAKRRFMDRVVQLLHAMGAPELARQYEWWTMKSQPNVLKRSGGAAGPAAGLCAIDFRPGLALLPYMPMSPADFRLILQGLFLRRSFAQFDRGDLRRLRAYLDQEPELFAGLDDAAEELGRRDPAYRRSLPDITRHGLRLLWDADLRRCVRAGLVQGYVSGRLLDEDAARKLRNGGFGFAGFYLLGALPLAGRRLRRFLGRADVRRHWKKILRDRNYRRTALSSRAAYELVEWHRSGRCDARRTARLARRPAQFYCERFITGRLPPGLHRLLTDPRHFGRRIRDGFRFLRDFSRCAVFRERWFLDQLAEGEREGMLTPGERSEIAGYVRDPFIVKYLKCLGVHFATLPVTQVFSILIGAIAAAVLLTRGESWYYATSAFAAVFAFFQVFPVSPGSLCRGGVVVYLMIRERNARDYLVAAPLSFVKYIGYLAFPLQMTATYPPLARFMAARWATRAVHIVPIFGESGALLEHWVFDLFFNLPQMAARWARPRIRGLLTAWLLLGTAVYGILMLPGWIEWSSKGMVNLLIAFAAVFAAPRLLIWPVMNRQR